MDTGYVAEVQELNHEWTIKNFEEVSQKDSDSPCFLFGAIVSNKFSSGSALTINTWEMHLFLNNYPESPFKDWISLYLKLTIPAIRRFIIDGLFYVLNKNNQQVMVKHLRKVFVANIKNGCKEFIGKNKLMELKDYLVINDTLTVGIRARVYDIRADLGGIPVNDVSRVVDDIRTLYETKIGADIVIEVGERKLLAHKAFLIARSPVFSQMYASLVLNVQNHMIVPKIKADTFESLLEFIYTDNVTNLDEFAEDLLEAAEKYKIQPLKHICEVSISKFLCSENTLRTLTLAKNANSQDLIDYVMNFASTHATEIFDSYEYKRWEAENLNPGLILFQNLADFNKKNNHKGASSSSQLPQLYTKKSRVN